MCGLRIYDNAASLWGREVGTSMVKKTGNSLKEKHRGKKSKLRTKRPGDRVQTASKKKPVKILAKKFKKKRQMIGAGVRTLGSITPPFSGMGRNHDALISTQRQLPVPDAVLDRMNDDEFARELNLGLDADDAVERANNPSPLTLPSDPEGCGSA